MSTAGPLEWWLMAQLTPEIAVDMDSEPSQYATLIGTTVAALATP